MVVSIVQKTDMQVTRAPRLLHLLSRLFTLCTFVASASGKQLEDHRAPAALESVLEAKENPKAIKLPVIIGHDLRFRRLPVANGLSQTKVSQIVQDDLGFLWFGTQYGLNRFDGYNFKVFKHEPGSPNSLSGVFVRSLFKDLRGNLWIGCDEFLDRYDPVTEAFVHYSIRAPGDDVPGAVVRHIIDPAHNLRDNFRLISV